jgi:dipeptidyl aminopeptidase/acylaminoacyl peptidase
VYPHFLPDGDHFLFLSRGSDETQAIMVGSLSSTASSLLVRANSRAIYDNGHVLFVRDQTLLALPFDAAALRATGDPFPIAEAVRHNPGTGGASIAVGNGVLAYRGGDSDQVGSRELTWIDRMGRVSSTLGVGNYNNPELSPDGQHLAIERLDPQTGNTDIWIADLARRVSTRITFDPGPERFPLWSPDGQRVAFSSLRSRDPGVYVTSAKGGGSEDRILETFAPLQDWSSDGNFIIYGSDDWRELWSLPLAGGRTPISRVPRSIFVKIAAQVSPDGRWVAYFSNESGRGDVYLQAFPTASGKWLISTNGGHSPRWRRDGKELFYVAADQKLMAVSVDARDSAPEISAPTELFDLGAFGGIGGSGSAVGSNRQQYDVSGDGQHFVVSRPVDAAREAPITIVVDWAAALRH